MIKLLDMLEDLDDVQAVYSNADISEELRWRSFETAVTIQRRRILGIDPGSRLTGFGIVDFRGTTPGYVASGTVESVKGEFPVRLKQIFESIGEDCG